MSDNDDIVFLERLWYLPPARGPRVHDEAALLRLVTDATESARFKPGEPGESGSFGFVSPLNATPDEGAPDDGNLGTQ